jgi:hypothetical protein
MLLAPTVEGRVADPCLATKLPHQHTNFCLLHNESDLRLHELVCLHGTLLSRPRDHKWKIPALNGPIWPGHFKLTWITNLTLIWVHK